MQAHYNGAPKKPKPKPKIKKKPKKPTKKPKGETRYA